MPRWLVQLVDTSSLGIENVRSQDVFTELLGDFAASRRIQKGLRAEIEKLFVDKNCNLQSSEQFLPLSMSQAKGAAKNILEGETLRVNDKTGKVRVASPGPRNRKSTSAKSGAKSGAKSRANGRRHKKPRSPRDSLSDTNSVTTSDSESDSEVESPRASKRKSRTKKSGAKKSGAKQSSGNPRRSPRRR